MNHTRSEVDRVQNRKRYNTEAKSMMQKWVKQLLDKGIISRVYDEATGSYTNVTFKVGEDIYELDVTPEKQFDKSLAGIIKKATHNTDANEYLDAQLIQYNNGSKNGGNTYTSFVVNDYVEYRDKLNLPKKEKIAQIPLHMLVTALTQPNYFILYINGYQVNHTIVRLTNNHLTPLIGAPMCHPQAIEIVEPYQNKVHQLICTRYWQELSYGLLPDEARVVTYYDAKQLEDRLIAHPKASLPEIKEIIDAYYINQNRPATFKYQA